MSALPDAIKAVSHEGRGVVSLQVVQRTDLPAMMLDAISGSADAAQLLRLTNQALATIQAAPRWKPALCGCCPRALRRGKFALIIARPACDDPTQGLALAICPKCGPDHDAIRAKAVASLARIWPDVRLVTHPDGGRA